MMQFFFGAEVWTPWQAGIRPAAPELGSGI